MTLTMLARVFLQRRGPLISGLLHFSKLEIAPQLWNAKEQV